MSSIISDIFYGSKQNILDNYLVNRHQHQQPSSLPKEQPSLAYTPFIQLIIALPNTSQIQKPAHFHVKVEMGTKTDQNILEIPKGHQLDTPCTTLILNDLEKTDLSKYSNLKITVSEGKYRNKVFGYIPIEMVKNLINYPSTQKTTILQVKGKHFIGFGSIQCTIRAEFPSNNILNSQIMKSMDKDQSSLYRYRDRSKEEDVSQKSLSYWDSHQMIDRQTRPYPSKGVIINKRPHKHKESSNIFIQDSSVMQKSNNKYGPKRRNQPIMEYEGEIKAVKVIFSNLNVNAEVDMHKVRIRNNENSYKIGDIVELDNFTKAGLQLQLVQELEVIGSTHLNALLLTLNTIKGDLPIHSPSDAFIGTVKISSAQNTEESLLKQPSEVYNQSKALSQSLENENKVLLLLNINKIIMINSINSLDSDSSSNIDPLKIQTFDFATIEVQNRLQIVVRVNEQTYKFEDIAIRYIVDKDDMKIVELRRKEGFSVHYFQEISDTVMVQIEIYSNYRLLSYSSIQLQSGNTIDHHFIHGSTDFSHCHCSLHLQNLTLSISPEYFQSNQLKPMLTSLDSILSNKLLLSDTSDESIKHLMNMNKKATYVQTKKLFIVLSPIINQIILYQQSQFDHILGVNLENKEHFVKFSTLILRELAAMGVEEQLNIDRKDFNHIINFYRSQYLAYQSEDFIKLNDNMIINAKGNVLYPFFLAGYFFQPGKIPQHHPQISSIPEQKQPQTQKPPTYKQIAVLAQPFYFIQKIQLKNVHLLNNGKIPNISLNISKKVHYSNASPQFIIEKDINLMEPITLFHKDISHNQTIQLAQFQPKRRQIHYELDLTGKATATIVWGL